MLFKLVHNKEIHMLSRKVNFDELLTHIKSTFKKLPKNFTLSYTDKEGDVISVTNEGDIDIIYNAGLPTFRLIIKEASEDNTIKQPVKVEAGITTVLSEISIEPVTTACDSRPTNEESTVRTKE